MRCKCKKKYLNVCIFQVAAAKPAIDSQPPDQRPHVHQKNKKALKEERRQTQIYSENLRILTKTAEIMGVSDYSITPTARSSKVRIGLSPKSKPIKVSKTTRSITGLMKRNTHVVLQWFLHKFGNYVPWWAQVSY